MSFLTTLLNITDLDERRQFASTLPLDIIYDICDKHTELNNTICLNEDFWKLKYLQKYKELPKTTPQSWKELFYQDKSGVLWSTYPYDVPVRLFDGPVKQFEPDDQCGTYFIDSNDYLWKSLDSLELSEKFSSLYDWNSKAKKISAGHDNFFVIDNDNNLWASGLNKYGELGLGDNNKRNKPTKLSSGNGWNGKVKDISTTEFSSCMIDMDNNVWVFGHDPGLNVGVKINHLNAPTKLPSLNEWSGKAKQVSIVPGGLIILDMNNEVWYSAVLVSWTQIPGTTTLVKLQTANGWSGKAKSIIHLYSSIVLIDFNDDLWFIGTPLDADPDDEDDMFERIQSEELTKIPSKYGLTVKVKNVYTGGALLIVDTDGDIWTMGMNINTNLTFTEDDSIRKFVKLSSDKWNGKASIVKLYDDELLVLTDESIIKSFDDISSMLSRNEISKFEFEPSRQVYYKNLQGIFVGTFTNNKGKKYYVYVRYDTQTNQILKP